MIRSFLRRHRLLLINVTSASGCLATSDFCVQNFYEKKKSLDDKRLVAALATGAVMGAEAHIWFPFLDRLIVHPTWRNVFKKVLLDQTMAAPIFTLTYIVGTSILEGRTSYRELVKDTQTNFLPLYIADTLIYIPIQIINFKYIPAFYRVPFLSFVAFIFDCFISAYKHKPQEIHVHTKHE
ncbi:unnamed protein product [Adineta steineri]|uniref:Mitochondrial inner membrane protein Mpv17 n=1 Tax=Adineta steineri TaxID=433720 RepID=A0A818ZXT8_9BILA|nr:unnamed protein product [Adineta steineri]CAF0728187.1 unnamed protein product [Adineta steineri]CAF0755534.1 unnamed protein product [Adineta steineri]CAF3559142.1 unnamed protein product [Adineta steineri]CAF3771535.1 unnamed protein product [Adineta steineri]